MINDYALLGPVAGVIALAFSGYLAATVMRQPAGTDRMKEISSAVRDGAMAFIKVEYRVVAMFTALLTVIFIIAGVATGGDTPALENFWYLTAAGFVVGAIFSALAGYIGLAVSVNSNARVAEAARTGIPGALSIAFRAGAVNGFAVVGLGILGLSGFYIVYRNLLGVQETPLALIGFAFGASLITLFARIAGGIYTKAADVGADLVGKIENDIPEDDPRNPAVIADNVGDNVGDCAGMGADLFETYVVTIIASMALAATGGVFGVFGEFGILFPMTLGSVAILSSILGIFFVRLGKSGNIMGALYKGVFATIISSGILFYLVWRYLFHASDGTAAIPGEFLWATYIGLALVVILVFVTEYYTSTKFRPVNSIADSSVTGAGTNIIQGLAVGLESVALPAFAVVVGLVASFLLGEAAGDGLGLYGIAMAATGMLSVAGMVVALDTYGPITDNAGGVAEMSELPADVRKNTDALDAVGNTTKATTKGYAIGSAALAALVLFGDFVDHASKAAREEGLTFAGRMVGEPGNEHMVFAMSDPYVLAGLLLGAAVVFLFGAMAMRAVGRAATTVVEEVRRQFADGKIMAGERKPDYAACVAIVTRAALREMAMPGFLAVIAPLAIGFILGPFALGGFLIGIIVAGLVLALLMANGGGAWDNAKKLIEDGRHGGKGSDAHHAAIVGDTVGDPFKDTAGPAINPLIKAINTIAVIFAAVIVSFHWLG